MSRLDDLASELTSPLRVYLAAALALGKTESAVERLLEACVRNRGLRMEQIIAAVSAHYRVGRVELISARRTKRLIEPRFMVSYLASILTGYSTPQIARALGNRDHSTICAQIRLMRLRIVADPSLSLTAAIITSQLYSTRKMDNEPDKLRRNETAQLAARAPAHAQEERGLR